MIQPWEDLNKAFESLVELGESFRAMSKLIEDIQTSRYKDGLFAWKSMHCLCIVQTPVIKHPHYGPYLQISPVTNGQLEFRYVDTNITEKQWCRVVDGNGGFARLELLLEQLHWFL